MFRPAVKSDLPGIIALWREAFGDSPEAVSYFFKSFPGCISYVADDGGEVVSMVHALPQTLSPDIPAAYVYAVATLRSHRERACAGSSWPLPRTTSGNRALPAPC